MDWDRRLAVRIGEAVQARRKELEWTAARLSEETSALGYPIHRVAIGKLENGHRGAKFDVAEIVVLAKALKVPPMRLLYPGMPGGDEEVLPGVITSAFAAAQWFSGEEPFKYYIASVDTRPELDRSGGPYYDGADVAHWNMGGTALRLAREEESLWGLLQRQEAAEQEALEGGDELSVRRAQLARDLVDQTKAQIVDIRQRQRDAGLTPVPTRKLWADGEA